MESHDELIQKVRFCMARNLPKLAIAMLAMGIITSLILSFSMVPIAASIMSGSVSIVSLVSLLFSTIAVSAINYVLQYGFFVLVLLLYSKQPAVFGHLFAGFRDFKRAFFAGLFFTFIYTSILLLFSIVLSFGVVSGFISEVMIQFDILFTVLGTVSIVILLALYIRYGFVWFLMYAQPELKVREALKQSALLTKGECLNFILFCIKSAGLFLLAGVLAFVAMQVLPIPSNPNQIYTMTFTLMRMLYTICLYVSLIRVSIAFAAWYTAYHAGYTDSKTTEHHTPDTVIQLPDSRTTDSTAGADSIDESKNSEE